MNAIEELEELWTREQVADYLKISIRKLPALIGDREDQLHPIRVGARGTRFAQTEIARYLQYLAAQPAGAENGSAA